MEQGFKTPFHALEIVRALSHYRYQLADEMRLQAAIADVLRLERIPFEREHVAGADRYDFICSGVVIEVKVKGSLSEALRQVERYCAAPNVAAVVLATTRPWAMSPAPIVFHGKQIHGVRLQGKTF